MDLSNANCESISKFSSEFCSDCSVSLQNFLHCNEMAQESVKSLAAIIESSEDAIIGKNLDGIILSWNKGAEKVYGYSKEEVIGKSISILLSPGYRDEIFDLIEEIKKGKTIEHYETLRIRKGGEKINVSLTISSVRDRRGKIIGTSTISRDITRHKLEEKELKISHDKLEKKVEKHRDQLLIMNNNLQEKIKEEKCAAEELKRQTHHLNKRVKELTCLHSISQLVEKEDVSLSQLVQGVLELIPMAYQYPHITCASIHFEGEKFQCENFKETLWVQAADIICHGAKKGSLKVFYMEERPEREEGPFLKEERELINNIAAQIGRFYEHKLAEDTLRYRFKIEKLISAISTDFINIELGKIDQEIEHLLQIIGEFTGAKASFIVLPSQVGTMENVYLWCNKDIDREKVKDLFIDYIPWTVMKLKKLDFIHLAEISGLQFEINTEQEWLQTQGIKSALSVPLTDNKSFIGLFGYNILYSKQPWVKENIELLKMVGMIIINALKHKEIEENLRMNENKFRSLYSEYSSFFKAIPDMIVVISPHLKILWANSKKSKKFGKENLLPSNKDHKSLYQCSDESHNCPVVKAFSTGKTEITQISTLDSKYFDIKVNPIKDETGEIVQAIAIASDITEKVIFQKEVIRTSHLASLGELAAGVAHEINNPINGIINCAQILMDRIKENTVESEFAGKIVKEGNRIAVIVKNLLSFARPDNVDLYLVHLGEIFSESLSLTGAKMEKDGIYIELYVPEILPRVMGQPVQIQQVFLNILGNARYALNQKYSKKDKNKILKVTAKEVIFDNSPFLEFSFYDQGIGIPTLILDKVMNPFFTTKPVGEGTGLGLSISYGIIKAHKGEITINSKEGEFTEVIIQLPVWRKDNK